jgi:glyoxylase-like metal-dependent hydrolase (beta-lactamase superfamily II)
MSVQSVEGCPDSHAVDVPMFGMSEVNSPYILDAPEPTIVDTGPADGVDAMLDALDTLDIDREAVSYIVPTHAHLDHAGGAGHLAAACENAAVVCHENAVEFLTDEKRLAHLAKSVERAIGMPEPYGEPRVIDRERCRAVGGGETLDVGDRTLDVIDAPGHAPHQLCLFDRASGALFSADANGMRFDGHLRPTTPPPDFDLEAALETLDRLVSFEPETICYAHFGAGTPGAGVAELHEYRELLPEYVEMIAEARERHGDDVGEIAAAVDEEWHHWALGTDVAGIVRYLDST